MDIKIEGGYVYQFGELIKTNVYIQGEVISHISDQDYLATQIIDATDLWVLPGAIDPHTHFHLHVGDTYSRDDFLTGSISAALGGVTTCIDFLDPVSEIEELEKALKQRLDDAKEAIIDYAFHATLKEKSGARCQRQWPTFFVEEVERLGIKSLKIFTTYRASGRMTSDEVLEALLIAAKQRDVLILAHIEKDEMIVMTDDMGMKDLPRSRSKEAERVKALEVASLVQKTGGRLYMVHCSSGETLQALMENFGDLLHHQLFIETCPHYLFFNQEVYAKDKGYLYAMAPPLRSAEEQRLLIKLLKEVDTIGTDHCSYLSSEKKKGKLKEIPMGVGGIGLSYPLMLSRYGLSSVDKMSLMPAKLFGLYPRKGHIAVGADADIVLYDPKQTQDIQQDNSASDYTIYEGQKLSGAIKMTLRRGQILMKDKVVYASLGKYLRGD